MTTTPTTPTTVPTTVPTRTITLTAGELTLVRNALEIMRSDFGHDQADLLREIGLLIDKLHRLTAS